jgi:predicted RNA polymerase sigma factor
VLYLIFNEGYAATSGADAIRPALCREAQRLGRILAGLMPNESEVHGLLALMELQASRLPTRTAADGTIIPLDRQNRARWDHLLIRHGLVALSRAEALGGGEKPYALQAALAACHARARSVEQTDWPRIAGLYDRLRTVTPSPVIDLNRAVAHGMAFGPDAGLALIEPLFQSPHLANYALLPAAKGDLLFRGGRHDEAKAAFERAAGLSSNAAERAFLLTRAASCVR